MSKQNISLEFVGNNLFNQAASNISISANPNQSSEISSQPPPPIPPQIGPDPRSGRSTITFEELPTCLGAHGIRFDFAFGYRIRIPDNATSPYQVTIIDLDSECKLESFTLNPGQTKVADRKFYIRYRIEIRCKGELILEHNYNCRNQKVYIVIPDGGLGDNLAWLPYAEEFRLKHGAKVSVVIGEWMKLLVGDLYPGLDFVDAKEKPILKNAYANYFLGIFNKEKTSWRPIEHQQIGMQGSVASILGLPLEPLKCRLHRGSIRPFPERFVCISTMATNPGKYWNYPNGWEQIITFLNNNGFRVLDIDRDPVLIFDNKQYTIPKNAEDFTGRFPIQDRINLLEHADFFIGLPSGLSWLAWNLDIPTVMISGFTMPNCEFPTPYRVTNYLYCHGCWNDSNEFFDPNVPVWCPRHVGTAREIECTKTITPKMVRETIEKIPQFIQGAYEHRMNPEGKSATR
ncbi:MAG: autotransporter strand-loop-strand O-heptosyltransferase [Lentisphaerae bacterium]|jgi:autotransporter strand-loop-strand O-heptosyltransferase|nr:autotransporter strand-loop-strand O-heptosyltransferase [Lentisphaerota bacterium]